MSLKAPSVVLIDEKKEFHSFGYEAEDKYAELTQAKTRKEGHYFTDIKMKLMNALDTFSTKEEGDKKLFKERLTRDVKMKDMEEREFPLLDIMAMAYKYLVGHFLKQLDDRNLLREITPSSEIQWVITVPAIWTDASRQFTKEAAIKAGLSANQIMLAYEPEAAALFCRLLPVDKFISGGEDKELVFSTFEWGKKFMVIDLGGGTVDVSVQETTSDGEMKSIHKVCGGAWGGKAVDEEFRKFVVKLFGGDVFKTFKEKYRLKYLAFWRDFELKKRQTELASGERITMRLPADFCDLQEDTSGCSLGELIKSSVFDGQISAVGDKLVFTPGIFKSFFDEAIQCIIDLVKSIIKHERCRSLTGIVLVGGFAESDMVIERLRKSFPKHKIVVPSEAGLAVVKGAVLYGHNPDIIRARTCRYTFGTSVAIPFIKGRHPIQRKIFIYGKEYCRGCFKKTFTIGDLVNIGEKRSIVFSYDFRDEDRQYMRLESLHTKVLITEDSNPEYSDVEGITKLGTVDIPLTMDSWPDFLDCFVDMEVSGTEMQVTCQLSTGHEAKGYFEFLSK